MRQRIIVRLSAHPPNSGEAGEVEMIIAYERAQRWLEQEYPEWDFRFLVLLGVADDDYDHERLMAASPAGR